MSGLQKVAYSTFLGNLTKKLEQAKNIDLSYVYKPNNLGDDYYGGYYSG